MKKNRRNGHIIKTVLPGGIAEEMGVEAGDAVVAVNGRPVRDIFDYRFLMADEEVTVTIEDRYGEQFLLEIEKDEEEDFGVEFEQALMDDYRSCCNRCIFCFIDQMPPGMRETLYFKDDDSRLSFLQGNYVTLTNMSDEDISRICALKMEPINISIHTTDPELRVKMLRNKNAGTALSKIDAFKEAGIIMNGQIVLCRGYNDGDALDRTIRDCAKWRPEMRSLSIVPVGLTRFREKLAKLDPFTKEDACRLIDQVEKWQDRFFEETGNHFVYASDEWYILAGRPLPDEERYDGYPQIENGVGMIRSFMTEAYDELTYQKTEAENGNASFKKKKTSFKRQNSRFISVTGYLACPYMREIANAVHEAFPEIQAEVVPIRNDFFGNAITVAGLVTGTDLIAQMKEYLAKEHFCSRNHSSSRNHSAGDTAEDTENSAENGAEEEAGIPTLLIPGEMLRMDEDVFLDDISIKDVREALGIPVRVLGKGGEAYIKMLLGLVNDTQNRRQYYEQADRSDRGQA